MRFPAELWPDSEERRMAEDLAGAFPGMAYVLTDRLANATFLSPEAEGLFGDRAEALVNRSAFSLLGFGERHGVPRPLAAALLGEGTPWRGVAEFDTGAGRTRRVVEASAVLRPTGLVCGFVRIAENEA